MVGKSVEQIFSNALADNKENNNYESRNDQPERFRRVGEKYSWQLESPDALNYSKFRDESSKGEKKFVSQTLGESYGHRFATEVLDYKTKLDPDSKYRSFPQGFDAVYYDRETGETVIGEFKGQDAQESEKQKRIRWTSDVCEQIINRQGVYAKASQAERDLAFDIKKEFDRGMVRYEVIRTKFDEKNGDIYTVVEKRKYSDYE